MIKINYAEIKNVLFNIKNHHLVLLSIIFALLIALFATLYLQGDSNLKAKIAELKIKEINLNGRLASVSAKLKNLEKRDEYLINKKNSEEIKNIQDTYNRALISYQKILDFNGDKKKLPDFEKLFAKILKLLSEKNYSSASASIADLDKQIDDASMKAAQTFTIPENVKTGNTPPSSGFASQKVSVEGLGDYLVSIVSADLGSTRVIVDTATDDGCRDNCPVLPLGDYVSRNGAFAGINGSYFCPAAYPQCAGKTNTYDTLLMNKNKRYFNSDNNVYSTVPAVIFFDGSIRFVSQSLEWGRDTSPNGVLANHPLMVFNNQVAFGGNSDPKQGSKGPRGFVGATGNTVYIGIVYNATVAEAARVLNKMGIHNALNLDSGGSTALWSGGYKAGPGRNIPNAILFVRK